MCAQACLSAPAGLSALKPSPLTPHPLREGAPGLAPLLPPGQVWDFPSLEAAARFAEEQLLAAAVARGLLAPALPTVTLEEVLAAHAGQVRQAGRQGGGRRNKGGSMEKRKGRGGAKEKIIACHGRERGWKREKHKKRQVRIRIACHRTREGARNKVKHLRGR